MTAAAIILFAAAAVIWGTPLLIVGAIFAWDFLACRGERGEREFDAHWFDALSVVDAEIDEDADLTFQRMCFEKWQMEMDS